MKKKTILTIFASIFMVALIAYAAHLETEPEADRAAAAAYASPTEASATDRLLVDFRDHASKEEMLVRIDMEPGEKIVVSQLTGVTDGMKVRVAEESAL